MGSTGLAAQAAGPRAACMWHKCDSRTRAARGSAESDISDKQTNLVRVSKSSGPSGLATAVSCSSSEVVIVTLFCYLMKAGEMSTKFC